MPRFVITIGGVTLIVHGLLHLIGSAVYMRLAEVNGPYFTTTLLGGRLHLGGVGTRILGALWTLPAFGFIVGALALWAGWNWWGPVLVGAAIFSLALTSLDWSSTFLGAVIDIAILTLLWLGPRIWSSLPCSHRQTL